MKTIRGRQKKEVTSIRLEPWQREQLKIDFGGVQKFVNIALKIYFSSGGLIRAMFQKESKKKPPQKAA